MVCRVMNMTILTSIGDSTDVTVPSRGHQVPVDC